MAVVGATGYAGAELVRILARHPAVELVGLVGRGRTSEPVETVHPHLAGSHLSLDEDTPAADAVFLALPHGVAVERVPGLLAEGATVIDLGPDFRLRDPAGYPRWYHFEHPRPDLLEAAVYGLPELHRAELAGLVGEPVRIVGAPGCYATASILALAPLARAGLLGDVVVDAKSGVSGAGRDAKAELMFGEVNESVKAYGIGGHRHVAEIEQEIVDGRLPGGPAGPRPDRLPAPPDPDDPGDPGRRPCPAGPRQPARPSSTRSMPRPTPTSRSCTWWRPRRPPSTSPAATRLGSSPPTTSARGRILVISVLDNLVKGAAGQAVQAFNIVHGLPETSGLDQLPLAP